MTRISPKRLLSEEEQHFCLAIAADFTGAEAYRRAFDGGSGDPKRDSKLAADLLKKPYIQQYVDELTGDITDLARQAFVDQMLGGGDPKNPSNLLGAAKAILADEQLQQQRTDLEQFWVVAALCGAEVVAVEDDVEYVAPVRDLVDPKVLAKRKLPNKVLEKTTKSLIAWSEKLEERERALREEQGD